MVNEIRIYFEGAPALTPGLGEFLGSIRDLARAKKIRWELIACGDGARAIESFRAALEDHPSAFNVLLVDAEASVELAPWEHLRRKRKDGWQPPQIAEEHCQLMVQMMEAWFVADVDALKSYYGRQFHEKAIFGEANVEKIEKIRLETALKDATKNTSKGAYHKTRHAPELLKRLNVDRVRKASQHCDRLFTTLADKVNSHSTT